MTPAPVEQPGRGRVRLARVVAAGADLLQIVLLPMFGPGFLSPAADVLDLAVAAVLVKLLGFHWAFLPTVAAEVVPGLDLVPTWTAAVLLVTASEGSRRWLRWAVLAALAVAGFAALAWWLHRQP